MRILHILDHSAPLQSGYVSRTLGIMDGQRELGWAPVGLTTPRHEAAAPRGAPPDEETERGFRFLRTPPTSRPGIIREIEMTLRRISRAIDSERPDVLHAHSPSLNAVPALLAGRRAGLPVVYEIRAFWEDAAVDLGTTKPGSAKYRMTRWLDTRSAHAAHAVITICEGLRSDLVARGVDAGKIHVVPNAVDTARHPPITERHAALAHSLGLGDEPVIGFIGSFYAYEGLDLLIEAFPAIRSRFGNARLLLVGGGPENERLRAMAAPFGDAILMPGRVQNTEVRDWYSLINVLAYPRRSIRLTELVTPLKPLEAMAMTRRFIASDIGGHRELIEDGRTGTLFPPGSADALANAAIAALETDAAPVLANARRFVEEKRSWRAVAGRYAPIYERIGARMRQAA